MRFRDKMVSVLAIVSACVTLVTVWRGHPKIAAAACVCVVLCALWFLVANRILPFAKLKRCLRELDRHLEPLRPDLLIAFDRTSGVLAGMLAERKKIAEILVLNRKVTQEGNIIVGEGISITGEKLRNRRIVIIKYHLDIDSLSLEEGLRMLEGAGLKWERVICLYGTPGVIRRLEKRPDRNRFEVLHIHEDLQRSHNELPWLDDVHVLVIPRSLKREGQQST